MKRILIIGSSGAGKSTFSRCLGEATGIEVVHLDQLYFSPNWIEMPKDEWKEKVAEVLQKDSWIIDGNYSGTMELRLPACDTVIFLDMPRLLCMFRVLKRLVVYYKQKRPDMAEGCFERFDWEFIQFVWNYPTRSRPKVAALLQKFQDEKKIIRLASKNDVENFFANLKSSKVEFL